MIVRIVQYSTVHCKSVYICDGVGNGILYYFPEMLDNFCANVRHKNLKVAKKVARDKLRWLKVPPKETKVSVASFVRLRGKNV